jgi:hypothetical protein
MKLIENKKNYFYSLIIVKVSSPENNAPTENQ